MTPIDTAALRAAAEDAEQAAYAVSVSLHPATVRALCDGYDEAARLREHLRLAGVARRSEETLKERAEAERDAARQALADFVADLRALCDGYESDGGIPKIGTRHLRAVIDRHAPEGGR